MLQTKVIDKRKKTDNLHNDERDIESRCCNMILVSASIVVACTG
jgi:hypothetical protein